MAEHRILALVQRQCVAVERKIQLLVDACLAGDVFAAAVTRDQRGDVGIADRDEVAARRIERVEKQSGVPGQRPAIARENLLAAMRKMPQESEILQVFTTSVELAIKARLMLGEPCHRLVEGVDRFQWMQARVGDDTDRVRTRR